MSGEINKTKTPEKNIFDIFKVHFPIEIHPRLNRDFCKRTLDLSQELHGVCQKRIDPNSEISGPYRSIVSKRPAQYQAICPVSGNHRTQTDQLLFNVFNNLASNSAWHAFCSIRGR